MNEILLANAALALLEQLLPDIARLVKSGAISPEAQQQLHDRYRSLVNAGDAAFQGPEWEIEK